MIQIGGSIDIEFKKDKFKFGKVNFTGKSEKNVIMALFKQLYDIDENVIINHIISSKDKKINIKNLRGISEIVHNYQYSSKVTSDFVLVFKSLNLRNRIEVLRQIDIRNKKRDEDCKSYTEEDPVHRELVNIGIKQYYKLQRMHDLMDLSKNSRLHLWLSNKPIIKKNRLSKTEKKQLKKQARKNNKSKKKLLET
jgi:hypothetical protein